MMLDVSLNSGYKSNVNTGFSNTRFNTGQNNGYNTNPNLSTKSVSPNNYGTSRPRPSVSSQSLWTTSTKSTTSTTSTTRIPQTTRPRINKPKMPELVVDMPYPARRPGFSTTSNISANTSFHMVSKPAKNHIILTTATPGM